MRHRRKTRKLGCKTPHRQAMLRNMVTSLFEHGRIVTTLPRAKELRRIADHMVTLAKEGSLHSRRQALQVIRSRKVVDKLFSHWAKVFESRNGGYVRIVRIGPRRGDAAMMTVVEAVEEPLEKIKKSGKKSTKTVDTASVVPQATDKDLGTKESSSELSEEKTSSETKTPKDETVEQEKAEKTEESVLEETSTETESLKEENKEESEEVKETTNKENEETKS